MVKRISALSVFVGVALLTVCAAPRSASAEEKGYVASPSGHVTTLKTTVVVGSFVRPTAVIEVARAKPEIKLKDLQDPKIEKIMRAAANAPF